MSFSDRLYFIKYTRKIFESLSDDKLEICLEEELIQKAVSERGANRLRKLREFTKSLNKLDLSIEENRIEFKRQMRKNIFKF